MGKYYQPSHAALADKSSFGEASSNKYGEIGDWSMC